jgi:hypothetical protein
MMADIAAAKRNEGRFRDPRRVAMGVPVLLNNTTLPRSHDAAENLGDG